MPPAFSSLLNRASQLGHPITPPSSPQLFWPPLCLLFLPSSSTSDGAALSRSGSHHAVGLGVAGPLSPSKGTNKRPAVSSPAGGILRKHRRQHPRPPLPPCAQASGAKQRCAAVRQCRHCQRASR